LGSIMTTHTYGRALATSLVIFGIGLGFAPAASADPADDADPGAGSEVRVPAQATFSSPGSGDATPEAVVACQQFAAGLDVAATNYSDFANNIAGDAPPNYGDPVVSDSNVTGRTALRAAAANAMEAAGTPGLAPEIAGPMNAWSGGATRLLILMGVRAPVDAINAAATDLNNNTTDVQMACVNAGTKA
jgi:hypothetical protein